MPRPSRYWPDNLPRPAHWDRTAACREADPVLFFPEGDDATIALLTQEAKGYCRTCPVSTRCQIDALERAEPFGVWGGLDERERRAILRSARKRTPPRMEWPRPEEAAGAPASASAAA
ncbi:WhiB family transcriptional regulator [Streptomyces sp. NPDC086776]|uniref:WhiB family transcriptional regulator n=1 Tax=Streptomyces sp. NPDC086776 TaxID=3365756 RepID=UPI00382D3062